MMFNYKSILAIFLISSEAAKDPLPSDGVINGVDCDGEDIVIVGDWCIPGKPHFDKEGDVCANDEKKNEAYCSYGIGPNTCAYCDNGAPIPILPDGVINGADCDGADIVIVGDWCIPGEPHFDPEGAVCANDETRYEAYCSYGVGPNACAYCDNGALVPILPEGVINGADCDEADIVIVGDWCIPGEPHFDKEGDVCANDGSWNEAFCSYRVGLNACAYCDNSALVPILPKGVINDGD